MVPESQIEDEIRKALKPLRDDIQAMDLMTGVSLFASKLAEPFQFSVSRFAQEKEHPYFKISFAPTVDDSTLKDWQSGYQRRATGMALQQLFDGYVETLDNLYIVLERRTGKVPTESVKKFVNTSQVKEKIKAANKAFPNFISERICTCLDSLRLARNSIVHAGAKVMDKHLNFGKALNLGWIGAEEKKAPDILQDLFSKNLMGVEKNPSISVTVLQPPDYVNRELSFKTGETIHIPPEALAEIFLFFSICGNELARSACRVLNDSGYNLNAGAFEARLEFGLPTRLKSFCAIGAEIL